MASYLAHEIRNPLFIIRGSAQTIEETSPDPSPPKKLASYIIEEVDRLNNMVQDLLGLVKPRLAPAKSPTSLKKAIDDSADRSLKQSPKVELVQQLDPEHDLVWFNRGQLIQVFTNLFRNARDACRGQGTILVESRVSGDGHLQIRVTDDGPGISEENLNHIFDPFFTGKENGTGLGLAIVRHLVTGNNASIEAVKPMGTGACFILNVRLAPDGAALPENEETEPVEDLG
jgi:signal transduction histidine kinase